MTSKKLIFLFLPILFVLTSFNQEYIVISKISMLTRSPKFKIGIERFELGNVNNGQYYFFVNNGQQVKVTHSRRIVSAQDTLLKNTVVNQAVLDSVKTILSKIKRFELDSPRKFKKKLKKSIGTGFDIIHIFNDKDTVTINDLDHGGMERLNTAIKNCLSK